MDFTIDEGTLFEIVEGKPDKGTLTLRTCNGEALQSIQKQTRKVKAEYVKRQRFEKVVIDDDLENELILDPTIVAWDNVKFQGPGEKKATPKECTKENKVYVVKTFNAFAALYTKFMNVLNEDLAQLTEESGGN